MKLQGLCRGAGLERQEKGIVSGVPGGITCRERPVLVEVEVGTRLIIQPPHTLLWRSGEKPDGYFRSCGLKSVHPLQSVKLFK